jgi:hypothetical protein
MSELKTQPTDIDVETFIKSFADTLQKQTDSFELLKLMTEITGQKPQIWGSSMIGFGSYHYKSERSRQEGNWPLVGFSPRKAAISLYVYSGTPEQEKCLENLGRFKMGKGCIYVKKLSDIDQNVLVDIIKFNIQFLESKFPEKKD